MFDRFYQIRDLYRTMGPLRFTILLGGILFFIVLIAAVHEWLASRIAWPRAYGFSCQGRGCFWIELYHSPQLLRGGTIYEIVLFALLWAIPGFLIGYAAIIVGARRWRRYRNRIRPMD